MDAEEVSARVASAAANHIFTKYWYSCSMARNTSISLDEHFVRFIDGAVKDGRYQSASEVVRAGLRLLEEQETKLAALRLAVQGGEESGIAENFDLDSFLKSMRR